MMSHRNESGSTIIEVIIAMLILSLLVVGLNTGVVSLIRSNISSKELNAATAAGNQRLENFRRSNYDDVIETGSSADTVSARYVRIWQMTTDSSQAKIDLTVRWPLMAQTHAISLSTIIARP